MRSTAGSESSPNPGRALTLSGTNGYTGGTVINGGTVVASAEGNLGAAGTSVTLNGGAFQFGGVFTTATARNFALGTNGGTLLSSLGNGASNPAVGGVISGAGPLTFDGVGS